MPAAIDITGQRFGRLVALAFHDRTRLYHGRWLCCCDCGETKIVRGNNLKNGHVKSCGCLNRDSTVKRSTIHGQTPRSGRSGTFYSWAAMMQRCSNPKAQAFKYYGARGVAVCERWRSFVNFLADMGSRPDGHSIERIDVNGNYEPGNCKWLPRSEQSKNTRRARKQPNTQQETLLQDSTLPALQS